MSQHIDRMSSDLLDALDKLNYEISRTVLQILLERNDRSPSELHAFFHGVSYQGFLKRMEHLEKSGLVKIMMAENARTADRIRLTSFGEVLIRSLLVAQKLQEAGR